LVLYAHYVIPANKLHSRTLYSTGLQHAIVLLSSLQVVKSPGSVTTVKLIGSSEAQQNAKSLIEEIVQLVGDVDDVDKGVESMIL